MSYSFHPHDPPVICQRCGKKRNASQLRKEWTGLRVCQDCWDPRHPQEFVRGRTDRQQVPGGAAPPTVAVFKEPASTLPGDL